MATISSRMAIRARLPEMGFAGIVVLVLVALVLPIPPFLLDLLLALSISLSFIVLLTAIYTSNPLDFSSFPSLLLVLTLFRLGLNVASTRLVLSDGYAGAMISAFGHFVIRDNIAVGLVIFLILTIINFIVITKGAGRIAEVAARFTLDAMPGRQMAIDADLNAGLIDEQEARARREEINREADFFAAMDGSSRFVRGDAIAGLVITAINLIGGLIIGVVQRGMPLGEAIQTYSMLTVGDGLVTQIPALILSTSAGVIVTQVSGATHVGDAVYSQLTRHTRALWIAAAVLLAFGVLPGLPFVPFATLATGVSGLAWVAQRRSAKAQPSAREKQEEGTAKTQVSDPIREILQLDSLEIELGLSLVSMADRRQGGDLLDRIGEIRKLVGAELGILVPQARVTDNINLGPNEYVIKLRGIEVANGEVLPRCMLAIDTGDVIQKIEGIRTVTEPSYGRPAVWISSSDKITAEAAGYTVVDPRTVLATHLYEVIRSHAADLLGRQEVQTIIDGIRQTHPVLVKDVVPEKVSVGTLHRVLQRLLREGVPVRDMVTILETISDAAERGIRDHDALVEHVRRGLSKVIARLYMHDDGSVHGIVLGKNLEVAFMQMFSPRPGAPATSTLSPVEVQALVQDLKTLAERHRRDRQYPPLLCSATLRTGLRRLIEPVAPQIPVVSFSELPGDVPINAIATWEIGTPVTEYSTAAA